MMPRPTLDEIWSSTQPSNQTLRPKAIESLPEAARRYLAHAMGSRSTTAMVARLRMHGEIKLERWLPFEAEEVIHADRGIVWKAAVRSGKLTIRGFDRFVDGKGAMQWKLLGLLPVMRASGSDIDRSAAGRFAAELVWLPSALARSDVRWSTVDPDEAIAHVAIGAEQVDLHLRVDHAGGLRSMWLPRWGNPEGGPHRYLRFGGSVEADGTFGGFTIPTRLRIGWHFGAEGFDEGGEFLRVQVDQASYR